MYIIYRYTNTHSVLCILYFSLRKDISQLECSDNTENSQIKHYFFFLFRESHVGHDKEIYLHIFSISCR